MTKRVWEGRSSLPGTASLMRPSCRSSPCRRPDRGRHCELLTAQYREAPTRRAGWQVLPLDVEVAVEAARIRAAYRLRLPDAIQVATVIRAGAAALVTDDHALRRVRGLRINGPE